ncbi:MAG: toxic anion resistance protein [Oscillospiraceae bacterium]|nr:toxic anion resistance protein [Oscillospiraceae bacterium]
MADFELTLNPNLSEGQAVQEAPAAPTLTLNPEQTAAGVSPLGGQTAQQQVDPMAGYRADYEKLSPAEKKAVDEFAKKINVEDSQQVMQYGVAAQKNIAAFSEQALNNVRTKDLGEVGEALAGLVTELNSIGKPEQEKKGFFGRKVQQAKANLETMKVQYARAETNVDRISDMLEQHQIALMKDIAMLDEMYRLNEQYYKELTMYILAGKQCLAELRAGRLKELHDQAERTGTQEDAQAYNDLYNLVDRFEKKLYDLELSRMVSIQMGPQTRLLQNNDTLMVQKIQTSLVNTIPLWKSQMVLALGLERSRQATAATSTVTEMTNRLLTQNADMLKMGTINTAREAERSIVDLETLQHTNEQLISSLDEVAKIQTEGRQKRQEAEAELARIEAELKAKLREVRA